MRGEDLLLFTWLYGTARGILEAGGMVGNVVLFTYKCIEKSFERVALDV
jgi:hypothetical protein